MSAPLAWLGDGQVVVVGATGGLGSALLAQLRDAMPQARLLGLSRHSAPPLDLLDEASIAACAAQVQARQAQTGQPLRLLLDATGFLHGEVAGQQMAPEKSWRSLDPAHLAHAFAINATGPALLMKHFLPLLPREGKAVFATLSAKVGSIGDNHLGGWYSYRAAKAALNQLVRTAAVELRRQRPQAVCVSLHPGTVDTGLSGPFAKTGLNVQTPPEAARRLLNVIDALDAAQHSGGFIDYQGQTLPW